MGPRIHPGLFIVFEGPDLSGKSGQARWGAAAVEPLGPVVLTQEPWKDNPDGEGIYKYLMDETKYRTNGFRMQQRFMLNRAEHVEHILLPALSEGKIVVSDRYIPSSIAYGKADGVDEAALWEMNAHFPRPDWVFILQISDEEARRRAFERGQTERLSRWDQDPAFQERVRANYWDLRYHKASRICKSPENVILLNGEATREEIQRVVKQHLLGMAVAR